MPNYKFKSSSFSFSISFVFGPRLLFRIVSKSLVIIHVSPVGLFGTLNLSAAVAQTLISQQLYLFRHVTLVTRCDGGICLHPRSRVEATLRPDDDG